MSNRLGLVLRIVIQTAIFLAVFPALLWLLLLVFFLMLTALSAVLGQPRSLSILGWLLPDYLAYWPGALLWLGLAALVGYSFGRKGARK